MLIVILVLLWCATAQAQWDSPTPQVLLYGDMESAADLTPIGTLSQVRVFQVAGKFGQGLRLSKIGGDGNSSLQNGLLVMNPRRGSLSFWMKLNNLTVSGTTEILDIHSGPPVLRARYTIGTPGSIYFLVDSLTGEGGPQVKADVTWVAGQWYHIVWTWWGMEHKLYVDGVLSGSSTLGSPMVPTQAPAMRVGASGGGTQDMVIDELTIYNVTLTQSEVTTLATAVAPGYLTSFAAHGVLLDAQWAPGEQRVHVAVDVGNDYLATATHVDIVVKNAAAATVGTGSIASLFRGFGEGIFPLSSMPPETYHVEVSAKDAANATLATASSGTFVVPSTPWLGNTLGLTDTLQAPWTPITKTGNTLSVIGREMDLSGGLGFPQQITSQGKALLATPLTLDIVQGGVPVPVVGASTGAITIGGGTTTVTTAPSAAPALTITASGAATTFTSVADHEATWTGAGVAGAVQAQVAGSLEYDGMMLFTVTLTPGAGPVAIDSMSLNMQMPAARAQWMHTSTDQRFWWYPYKAATGSSVGVFHTNLMQQPHFSTYLPVVVFSDHDVGLEWFADNLQGWVVNEAQVVQQMMRDAGDIIRLENKIANKPFTLTTPLTFTFGLMATPTKPLPSDWRTLSVHFNPLPITSTLHLWWAWPSDTGGPCCRQGQYNLYPVDPAGWNAAWATKRAAGTKVAPFINAHIELPHGTDTWDFLFAVLKDETQNDGWIAQPTRGMRDYYVYQLNQWFATGGLDAVYIDESYGFLTTQFLLAGGYIKEDGTHGYGHNTLGVRKQLKRIRQLFTDHAMRPLMWIHNTATSWAHVWSWADIVSDGEAYTYETPTDPDWVDTWGTNLLTPVSGIDSANGGPWLLSISRAQKWGQIPLFLDYIKFFSNVPEYQKFQRQYHGLTGLLDIIPIEYRTNATTNAAPLLAAKEAFGIGAADVTWQGYWSQAAVVASRSDIPVSYWKRMASALALVMNLGEAFTGPVTVDLPALGLAGGTVKDGETNTPYTVTGGQITMTIPRHDYRLLRMDAP